MRKSCLIVVEQEREVEERRETQNFLSIQERFHPRREKRSDGRGSYNFIRAMLILLLSKLWCCCCLSFVNSHQHQEWPSLIDIYVEGYKVMGKLNPNHLGTLLPGLLMIGVFMDYLAYLHRLL